MSAILDVGLPDNTKPLVEANHPLLGDIQLHANSLIEGKGAGKANYWANYQPQSGLGTAENAQFDILISPSTGSINVIDQLFLQLSYKSSQTSVVGNVTYKPMLQWLNRVEISMDGGNILQIIYGDQNFADTVNNSTVSNLDDIKENLNLDPRNYLSWFDLQSTAPNETTAGIVGGSSYLAQPYVRSIAAHGIQTYCKGGQVIPDNTTEYTGYIPFFNTIMQQAKILLSALKSNIRLRFYLNNQILLVDSGFGTVNACSTTLTKAILWAAGAKLSPENNAALVLKYQNPVISSFNYFLEFSESYASVSLSAGSFKEAVLSPLTGYCSQLIVYLQDDRQDQAYPANFKQNNMMTLPMDNIQFVTQDGSIYGSGLPIPDNLLLMMNSYKSFPKSVSQDGRLYFRKYYYIEFSKFPIATAENAVYGGSYNLTGRERIRFTPDASFVTQNKELNVLGNDLATVAGSALYTNCSLHVIASIFAEAIESGGLISANLPRNLN